jgi:hypothetical protein
MLCDWESNSGCVELSIRRFDQVGPEYVGQRNQVDEDI